MINKVELQGIVGNVRTQQVTENELCARLSLATDYYYKDREGGSMVDVTWHNVSAWQSQIKGIDLSTIAKGDKLHVIGRIRNQHYCDAEGRDRYTTEIVAQTIRRAGE